MRRWLKTVSIAGAIALIVVQAVPYGREHTNPPVLVEPVWDSRETRTLAVAACFDCHSNETEWPWYSNIAPMSWALQRDVDSGRDELNFSEWDGEQEGDEAAETVRDGSMPPFQYRLAHPGARLTKDQVNRLIAGLAATFGDKESGN